MEWAVEDLNRVLRGWGDYFRYGNSGRKFSQIDCYVNERLALLASAKHGLQRPQLGHPLQLPVGEPARHLPPRRNGETHARVCQPVNDVGEPCAGEPHARFDAAAGGNPASRLVRAAMEASRRPYITTRPTPPATLSEHHDEAGVRAKPTAQRGKREPRSSRSAPELLSPRTSSASDGCSSADASIAGWMQNRCFGSSMRTPPFARRREPRRTERVTCYARKARLTRAIALPSDGSKRSRSE